MLFFIIVIIFFNAMTSLCTQFLTLRRKLRAQVISRLKSLQRWTLTVRNHFYFVCCLEGVGFRMFG